MLTLKLDPLARHLLPDGREFAVAPLPADELADWLDTLPAHKPLESARALVRELSAQHRAGFPLRTRLKLLELTREKAESLLPAIEERLNHAALPLPPALEQAVAGANELLKALCAGYSGVVGTITRRWSAIGLDRPLRTALSQGLRLNQRRLKLAYRVHARGSPGAWSELHRLYCTARDAGLAGVTAEGEAESPERIYVNALLLAFAEPAKFGDGDLDRVRFYVERHGHLAHLEPADAGLPQARGACFLIRPREGRPGQALARLRDGDIRPGDLLLRCADLADHLEGQIAGLEQGRAPAELGLPRLAGQPQYQALLRSIARLWRAPPTRRFHRSRFHPRVDVVVGCAALRRYVTGAAWRRRAQDEPGEPAPRGNMTEWTVTNESPDGLALRYVGGNTSEVQVGEVLGVRPRGTSALHVCIVRRAEAAAACLEIGVQVLASHALAASIRLPGDARGGAVQALLLPRLPGFGGTPALLAPPLRLAPGVEFATRIEGRSLLLKIGRRVEKTASCELFALEPALTSK